MNGKPLKRNIIQIFDDASIMLSGKWGQMIGGTALVVFTILSLNLIPAFGLVLSFVATGFIALGYIRFVLETYKGKTPDFEVVFKNWRQTISAFTLRLMICLYTALWSLVLIIPGIITAINYSFAMTIMTEEPKISALDAMQKSKKMVWGFRDNIFVLYLLIFFFMIITYALAIFLPLFVNIFTPVPIWVIFTVASVLSVFVYVSILLPFAEMCLVSIYLEAKEYYKSQKTTSKKNRVKLVEENKSN